MRRLRELQQPEHADLNPISYVAKNSNPNILSHRNAMKADDHDKFLSSMREEMDKLFDNDIYEIVPRKSVPSHKTVLDAVWSHRRKQKPDGTIYR